MKRTIAFLFMSIVVSFVVFAQGSTQETITLTTYYPSPVGVYNRLVTNTLGVGNNDGDTAITIADTPDPASEPGDVWIAGNVGIGTMDTSGPAKLKVNGDIDVDGGIDTAGYFRIIKP